MDQIVYQNSSKLASDNENYKVPPFDKNMKVLDLDTFYDTFFGEYLTLWKS